MDGIYYCTYLNNGDKAYCSNYRGISLLPVAYYIQYYFV